MLLTPIDMYGIHLWDDMKVELMGGSIQGAAFQ